jgi:phosphoribosylformylglycinamidine synthase
VGGILRDIFTMGARPIATLDPLRFGPPTTPRARWLIEGVVDGISSYGNSVGVPTVGGEVVFDDCSAENPLVNVMCVGVMPVDNLVLGRASDAGNLAVLLGSTTGRDGIGGVSVLASAGFGDDDEGKRPSVQVGDPFEEKRLIEACLALYDAGLVAGIQDLGGAGLTCATSETASRGGMGMDVDVDAVPRREPGMEPFEVMTSESQERMLAIVRPDALAEVTELCRRWEVRATVVGRVNDSGRLRVLHGGDVVADVPAASLHEDAPLYDRPRQAPADLEARRADDPGRLPAPDDCGDDVLALTADLSWVWSQYDHQLFLNTVEGPGGDAAVLRLKAPGLPSSRRGIAVSTDGNHRWCALDPRRGTALVVAEGALNLACAGATPVAIVNCLNFGNPEHPDVMWQLSEAIDGMAEAATALGIPVVGGNVSLYNESRGRDIDPTPVVGSVGLIDTLDRRPPGIGLVESGRVLLLGDRAGLSLAGSAWARRRGHVGGQLPDVDYERHRAVLQLVRTLVVDGILAGVHDVSDGGLGVALAEMAFAGGVGFRVSGVNGHAELFSEAPSRVVVCALPDAAPEVLRRAREAGVPASLLGGSGGDRLMVEGLVDLDLGAVDTRWRSSLPEALAP